MFEFSPWGRLANLGVRTRTLQRISLIFFLLQQIIMDAMKDRPELIMARLVFLFSLDKTKWNLAFSMARVQILAEKLGIGSGVSKIMPGGQY